MHTPKSTSPHSPNPTARWVGIALVGLFALVLSSRLRLATPDRTPATAANDPTHPATAWTTGSEVRTHTRSGLLRSEPNPRAEEIVAAKLTQFSRSRRELAHALARRHGIAVPDEVERFFDAVESGDWDRISASFSEIHGGDTSGSQHRERTPDVNKLWPAIMDAFGVAEQVHEWPAQQLLDYGNAILDSLRPGMVYVGGTDNGRWIPELLNETSGNEPHIILTQNALADLSYLDYVNLQYGDRFQGLSSEEGQTAFSDYIADAERRFAHDRDFPDEPKQVRPGEQIAVGGQRGQIRTIYN